tara:strand:- start:1042 stop:1647 length:606 start_codon:yes stop_codon:yes gene_type:complete
MKILIVPSIREIYKNQLEYCVDLKLIDMLKKLFRDTKIEIYNNKLDDYYDLILLSGGNDVLLRKRKDKIRFKINNLIFNFALKKKIKIIGICYGAQYLAKKYRFKIKKINNHVGSHNVYFNIKDRKFTKVVNSFHNCAIELSQKQNIDVFGIADDNTIEAFHIKKNKILGIMWHPERYKKIKKFDLSLIKSFYTNNSVNVS